MSMDKVLVYVRPWNNAQFHDISKQTWPAGEFTQLSEHKGFDKSGFIDKFYLEFSKSKNMCNISSSVLFKDEEISDIVDRCRLLRAVDSDLSVRILYSASKAIDQVLDELEPKYILSVTVDSYIIDLLARLANKRGIKFIGLVPTFVDGYFRITERGEKAVNRIVTPEEVDAVVSMLTKQDYKPQWLAANKKAIRRKAIRLWARNLIKPAWFFFYSRVKRDPLNAHYMTTDIVSRRYLSFMPTLYSELESVDLVSNLISNDSRRSVFLPLQMSPEATIDYWSSDKSWINYEDKILSVINEYARRYIFVVKEHPNVFGFRTRNFYKKLLEIENVVLVNPEVSSNELLELCDSVLVSTGTVGFEALLRGKPVMSTSEPFYATSEKFLHLGDDKNHRPDSDRRGLVEYLLSGCSPGVFINDGSWNENVHSDSKYNEQLSYSIKKYISEYSDGC